jgi:glucokinase
MAEAPGPLAATGVGCGGPMSPGGERVSPLHIPAWRDFPLRARLAAALRTAVFVDNDAKALTRAEAWIGAAAGRPDVLGMVVSTGVGGGLLSGGRMLEGAGGNAGHIGHVVVEPDGLRCACGARGCLEAYAAGPAIARWSGRRPEEATPEVVERVGTLVGRAVASVANLLDVRLAVVAGSVALGFGTPFFTAAQAELDRRSRLWSGGPTTGGRAPGDEPAPSGPNPPRIRPAALGADGPLVGAAAVAFAGLGDR